MSEDGRFPSFERSDLKDYSSSPAVDRVWQRLDASLDERPARQSRRSGFVWATAAAAATFVGGIWVGRQASSPDLGVTAMVSAEPSQLGGGAWTELQFEPVAAPVSEAVTEAEEPEHVVRGAHRGRYPRLDPSSRKPTRSVDPAVPEPVATDDGTVTPPTVDTPSNAPAEASVEPPKWQRLANGGEYEAASFELSQLGGFETVLAKSSPEQLMLLVDIARATGQRQRAISALRRVVGEFPSDPNAPIAAWSLGTLLETTGDKRGANEAFAAYRALSPQGDFAEDALVRQLRSAVQRRERDLARELASQYSHDFPEGTRRDEVARWMVVLEAADTGGDADAGAPEEAFPELEQPPRPTEPPQAPPHP